MGYAKEYRRWCERAAGDAEVVSELREMASDGEKIKDAFSGCLRFGTGGLRGTLGAGANRMNIYTVAKISQGVAEYVKKNFPPERRKIAVSFDSRIKSGLFSRTAAGVFAANGIRAAIYPELMPTPCLSYAVRALSCAAGIMVTASHNPRDYNGYKVYGPDGCQITPDTAEAISAETEKLDIFDDVKRLSFDEGLRQRKIFYIPKAVYDGFIREVKAQSVLFGEPADKGASIIYSPLNGSGLKPVLKVLRESGYANITVVAEQEKPNGDFPTCPYPNPEIREAMELGMEYAARCRAELFLATDPDCDRVGVAVRDKNGKMALLSGNETGILLLDYICSQRTLHGKMPDDPVLIETVVTTELAERVAKKYGVRTIRVLTGFKFIGEQLGLLEKQGRAASFIFGFEESCGYLSGPYVRDKDAVGGALLICEMFAYHRARGRSLLDRLEELYAEYGYCLNTLHSSAFEGPAGPAKIRSIMKKLRSGISRLGSKRVERVLDYAEGLEGLPGADVLKYILEGSCSAVVRPSGTEPKLKTYIGVSAADKKEAAETEAEIYEALSKYFAQA